MMRSKGSLMRLAEARQLLASSALLGLSWQRRVWTLSLLAQQMLPAAQAAFESLGVR